MFKAKNNPLAKYVQDLFNLHWEREKRLLKHYKL